MTYRGLFSFSAFHSYANIYLIRQNIFFSSKKDDDELKIFIFLSFVLCIYTYI